MIKRISAFLAILLFLNQALWAVPHIHPELYPNAKPCHIKVLTPEMLKRYGSPRAAVIHTTTGPKNIAVILVQFAGAGSTTSGTPAISTLSNFDAYFNGPSSMKTYYNEVSFGKIQLTFSFFGSNTISPAGDATAVAAGAYTFNGVGGLPNHPMEYYGCGDVDPGCNGVSPVAPATLGGAYLIHDALVAARTHATGPTWCANVDPCPANTFDAVLVMHAGFGNETTGQNGDVWSAFYQDPAVIGADGTTFQDGATFPELESNHVSSPLGVMCHEFGHVLTLPDLYNTSVSGGSAVVGFWDLMDGGPYAGPLNARGLNPSHMGAWDLSYLGWAIPKIASSRGSFGLTPISKGNDPTQMVKMPILGSTDEYFLLEYRSKTVGIFDREIPGTGLLIWHIDDAITSARGFAGSNPSFQNQVNTGSPHYGVSIVPADGISVSATQGTAGNLYSAGDNFTSPKSDSFSGQPSGVSVVKVAGVGGATATFEVVNLAVSPSQMIHKVINFPNPAGKGYNHPRGPGYTTLQFQLGRPVSDVQINIYTLSGDLVRKVAKSDIILNTDRSADEKWVYEFDWDLKNGDGQHVAPGVYLYLVRADGQSKSAKAVVIR